MESDKDPIIVLVEVSSDNEIERGLALNGARTSYDLFIRTPTTRKHSYIDLNNRSLDVWRTALRKLFSTFSAYHGGIPVKFELQPPESLKDKLLRKYRWGITQVDTISDSDFLRTIGDDTFDRFWTTLESLERTDGIVWKMVRDTESLRVIVTSIMIDDGELLRILSGMNVFAEIVWIDPLDPPWID